MKLRNFVLICIIACATMTTFAQEQTNTLPDLYTADQQFFDPTKKEVEDYQFAIHWRLQVGYAQPSLRTKDTTVMYSHGLQLGATVDFKLPYRFSIQTGALLKFTYGVNKQHWANRLEEDAQVNILKHNILNLQLAIPVRAYYNINIWKKLNFFLYGGPQLNIGLTNYDIIQPNVSESALKWMQEQGIHTTPYDKYVAKELYRTNIQMGVGGGLEWDKYRIQAGYDFGLNNLQRNRVITTHKLYDWGWYATFSYQL
jgi:opacity protein-like surface antigen